MGTLTSITIPASVTSLGDYTFFSCSSLTNITIPGGITIIGSNVFASCIGLTSIEIPSNVTTIGTGAFFNCSNLASVTIHEGVTSIGNGAFVNCAGLTSITVNVNNPTYASQDGILYNKAKTSILTVPAGISGSITIPTGITSIGVGAFYGCAGLTGVTIGEGVTSIGNQAFRDCTGLTGIEIPASVTSIDYDAFRSCTSLTSINIPANVTTIGSDAFYGCSNLRNIIIDNDKFAATQSSWRGWHDIFTADNLSVTFKKNVENSAFYNVWNQINNRLTSVNIIEGVTSIGQSAFYGCHGLTSVTIPASVTSIGSSAFMPLSGYQGSLTTVTFAGTIASGSFSSTTPFPGDLRAKFYATNSANGTPGTYIVTSGTGNNKVWTRQ